MSAYFQRLAQRTGLTPDGWTRAAVNTADSGPPRLDVNVEEAIEPKVAATREATGSHERSQTPADTRPADAMADESRPHGSVAGPPAGARQSATPAAGPDRKIRETLAGQKPLPDASDTTPPAGHPGEPFSDRESPSAVHSPPVRKQATGKREEPAARKSVRDERPAIPVNKGTTLQTEGRTLEAVGDSSGRTTTPRPAGPGPEEVARPAPDRTVHAPPPGKQGEPRLIERRTGRQDRATSQPDARLPAAPRSDRAGRDAGRLTVRIGRISLDVHQQPAGAPPQTEAKPPRSIRTPGTRGRAGGEGTRLSRYYLRGM